MGLPRWLSGKEPTSQCRRHKRHRFDPWVRKIPWRRKWQPTPVFLPGKSHGQRRLAGSSPWGHEWVTTEHTHACVHTHTHTHTHSPNTPHLNHQLLLLILLQDTFWIGPFLATPSATNLANIIGGSHQDHCKSTLMVSSLSLFLL